MATTAAPPLGHDFANLAYLALVSSALALPPILLGVRWMRSSGTYSNTKLALLATAAGLAAKEIVLHFDH